ncbi:erythromycin esterase family protein [Maribacter sp. ACAM166]|uniref:erythromycin esterase family protein n=1 Tax=Maribacter sp. ACAM166 TaxID=2508996 RepID=UPI0010FCF4A6|nr:erythromycin esterase family protein [Maribacter sp. ACAM166]TLP81732.1 erythromycin esterase family protein [Maribacter sp. ACAM166]
MDIKEQRIAALKKVGKKLENTLDLDPLIEKLSGSSLVLLGEASHGTHEYYTWRTAITKRLIEEHGFNLIAVEGDWPDFYRVNRYVKHYGNSHQNSVDVLKKFNRWPTWMWANWEIETLTDWLYTHNEHRPANERVGIYGLDVYSLWESMEAIIDYLKIHDLILVPSAKRAMGCFEPFGDEMGMAYARSLQRFIPKTCENEVVSLLQEIKQRSQSFNTDIEATLNMEQNAHIAKNAESYYRSMVHANQSSWNIRDHHMMDTLQRLLHFHGGKSKAIVWEHNTHVGDARATDMALDNTINVGQLVREELSHLNPKIVGFGSYQGTVVAGSEWGAPMRNMHVPPAIEGSWEYLLHRTGKGNQLLFMEDLKGNPLFKDPIGHRAIGVVYHPKYEKIGNYVPSVMPERYDAFIHIDTSEGVHAMDVYVDKSQLPETYPWAF